MTSLSDSTFKQIHNTAKKLHESARSKFFERIKQCKSFREIFEILLEIEESQGGNNEKDN